jgi:bifunctional DNA-binding transcriptional regulator/antitoxin component of YhaV-PrlF toxin-antitoxin module
MELVKLGKKGQVTIPQATLRSVGVSGEAPLLVETTSEGAILLRRTVVYPIELYSDHRIEEFERENAVPDDLQQRVLASLKRGD